MSSSFSKSNEASNPPWLTLLAIWLRLLPSRLSCRNKPGSTGVNLRKEMLPDGLRLTTSRASCLRAKLAIVSPSPSAAFLSLANSSSDSLTLSCLSLVALLLLSTVIHFSRGLKGLRPSPALGSKLSFGVRGRLACLLDTSYLFTNDAALLFYMGINPFLDVVLIHGFSILNQGQPANHVGSIDPHSCRLVYDHLPTDRV